MRFFKEEQQWQGKDSTQSRSYLDMLMGSTARPFILGCIFPGSARKMVGESEGQTTRTLQKPKGAKRNVPK